MNKIVTIGLLVVILSFYACKTKKQQIKDSNVPAMENTYLGQKPPGLTPIPFAPGLVSTEIYEYDGAFTPDMKAFYFIRRGEKDKKSDFYEYKYNETTKTWEK